MYLRTALVVLASLATLPATDIYLPSLPGMATYFSVSEEVAQTSISIYLIGSLLSALVLGVMSDRFGRKPVMLLGLSTFFAGSLLCSAAATMPIFMFGRFLQGSGAIAAPIVGWAIIHDIYPKHEGAGVMAWLGAIFSVSPLVAPFLGGFIDVSLGWRWNFILLSMVVAITICLFALLFDETRVVRVGRSFSPKKILNSYVTVISNTTFLSYVFMFSLMMCAEWCYLTVAPFYFEGVLHFTPDIFGFYMSLVGLVYFVGTLFTSTIIKRFGVEGAIAAGLGVTFAGAAILVMVYAFAPMAPIAIVSAIGIYLIGSSIIWGPSTTMALQCFEHERGTASAVRSLILTGCGVVGSFSGSFLNTNSLLPLALFLMACTFIAVLLFIRLRILGSETNS